MKNNKLARIVFLLGTLVFTLADMAGGQGIDSSGFDYRTAEATPASAASPRASSVAQQPPMTAESDFPAFVMPGEEADDGKANERGNFAGPLVTTISSLLVVLAIFGVFVWVSRRFSAPGKVSGALPESVVRNLGSTSIDPKTRISFLRVGSRILVIGQNQQGDPRTLSEITDPEEVEHLTNRCLGRPEIVGRRSANHPGNPPSRRDLAAG